LILLILNWGSNHLLEFFLQLLIILLATKLAGDISARLGQPTVLGKLIIGIIIGPAVLGWIPNSEIIHELSQLGILLLMFIAGLETDLGDLNKHRNSSIAVALGGLVFPLIGGYVTGLLFGMNQEHALFLGLLLAATSVSISVQTLKELGQLKSRESTTILGAALVDDILVVITLAIIMGFLTGSEVNIGMIIGEKVLFFMLIVGLGWKFVPWVLNKLASFRVTEAIMSAGLLICLFFAYIAEFLGVSGMIGAFAAGIAISRTNYKKEVAHKIEPIAYTIFVPIFFVSIGLSVSFESVGKHLGFIIVASLIAIFTKWIGAALGAKLTGFSTRSALGIGAGMISRGEVALILVFIGLESQLLERTYLTSVLIVVIVTSLITPPLLKMLFRKQQKQTDRA
jgi:monovalent cation:proton antiporter-2 (CPA2) family protein